MKGGRNSHFVKPTNPPRKDYASRNSGYIAIVAGLIDQKYGRIFIPGLDKIGIKVSAMDQTSLSSLTRRTNKSQAAQFHLSDKLKFLRQNTACF